MNEQFYRDTYSMALGAEYDVDDRLTLRAGTMFDESPITDEYRTTRVPDGDRTWLSVGASYDINDTFTASLDKSPFDTAAAKTSLQELDQLASLSPTDALLNRTTIQPQCIGPAGKFLRPRPESRLPRHIARRRRTCR